MSFYQLISDRLKQAGFDYEDDQISQLDIVEYMALECAGALHLLQGKPLQCFFQPDYTSNLYFQDNKARSSLEYGLSGTWNKGRFSISEEEQDDFYQIVRAIEDKFPESAYDYSHDIDNRLETLYGVILLDENIEKAIRASSLYVAAGDLSAFDLTSLLLLKNKLGLYKIADNGLSALTDRLIKRIDTYLSMHFESSLIQQTLPLADKQFVALLAIAKEEKKYNRLLDSFFSETLSPLIKKGTEFDVFIFPPKNKHEVHPNKKYEPNYSNIALIAQALKSILIDARNQFFNEPLSQERFNKFRDKCQKVITDSKKEFAKYRGWAKWYNELNPFLQGIITCIKVIGGILAGLAVVPAVLVEHYSDQGYIGSFFNSKTRSLRQLEQFEHTLCDKNGIIDTLDTEMPLLGMG